MSITTVTDGGKLPGRFVELVRMMPPRAISDDGYYEEAAAMVDRLMGSGRLTKGQELYLETLVQLVQAYEAKHHAVDTAGVSGLDALRHLMQENGMSASELGRVLGVHPSMGSKILKGERSLTVDHLRKLSHRFGIRPELFMT